MLEIVAPEGWVPPPPPEVSNSDVLPASDSFGGDFDDIDKILSNPAKAGTAQPSGKPKQPGQKRQQQPRQSKKQQLRPGQQSGQPKQKRRSPHSAAAQAGTVAGAKGQKTPAAAQGQRGEPVLPNDQWTSDETKKRRSRVNKVAGLLGALLLMGAIGAGVWFNLQKPNPEVAKNDEIGNQDSAGDAENPGQRENNKNEAFDPDSPLAGNGNIGKSAEDDPNNLLNDDAVGNIDQPGVVENNPPQIGGPAAIENSLPEDGGNLPPNMDLQNNDDPGLAQLDPPAKFAPGVRPADPPALDTPGPLIPDDKPLLGKSPFEIDPKPAKPVIGEIESELGALSEYLEGRGTSLDELEDIAAAIRQRPVIGIPKYIVERAQKDEIERLTKLVLAEQLQLPLGGIQFTNIPLANALRTITKLSGVPITLDVRTIADAGVTPNPNVSKTIKDANVEEALTAILGEAGLAKFENQILLRVGVSEAEQMVNAKFDFPNVAGIDEMGKSKFLVTLQTLVEPESWHREDTPATLAIEGDQIAALCSPRAKYQIERFISKIQAAIVLIDDPQNANAQTIVQSRWKSAAATLAKAPKLQHGSKTDIGTFLDRLHKNTGATIAIDWASVLPKQWTPQTHLPGNITEPTTHDLLVELSQSLGVTLVAVDATTFMLTSHQTESTLEDIEVYPVSEIVGRKMNERLLMRQIQQVTKSQKGEFVYDPKTKCIIGLAPQSVQRQVESVLDRLNEI